MKSKLSFLLFLVIFLSSTILHAQITGFKFGGIKANGDLTLSNRIGKISTDTTHIINIADCKKYLGFTIRITWSLNYTPPAETKYAVKMSLPGGSCGTSDLSTLGDQCHKEFLVSETKLENPANNEFDVSLSMLMNAATESDCERSDDKITNIYIVMNDTSKTSYQTIQFQIDLLPPTPPVLSEDDIVGGDSNLHISFKDETNTKSGIEYKIYYHTSSFDDSSKSAVKSTGSFTAKSYQLTGLDNDVLYYVAVSAIDENDNESAISNVQSAMPVKVIDYWEHYKNSGGHETGGFCSALSLIQKNQSKNEFFLLLLIIFAYIIFKLRLKGICK